MTTAIPAPGFADASRDAQRVFRAVLDALAHPTRSFPVSGPTAAPAPLGRALGAVALTVLDEECSAWLDARLAADVEVTAWLAFHTGVRLVADPADAQFLLTGPRSLPPLDRLARGTEEAPHRSATVLLDVRGCTGAARFVAEGPGVDGTAVLDAPWADGAFLPQWVANTRLFPRGVDLVLVDEDGVAALWPSRAGSAPSRTPTRRSPGRAAGSRSCRRSRRRRSRASSGSSSPGS